jgi:predicted molibdopterin-dependent oxidoreductase YjgC
MSTESVKVTINGKDFQVPKGARLIDVCRDKGFDIPSFCYYSDLTLQASCRMCLVRIEKMPKLQTSCTIICTDGMIVTTQSEEIEKAQRGMTEFLLANHPLDCPVCDRGGECELQEMTFDWGGLEERFTEEKNYYAERYRGLSDRNAARRDLPAPDTPVGTRAIDHDLQLLFGWLPDVARLTRRRGAAFSRARSLRQRHQRRVSLR